MHIVGLAFQGKSLVSSQTLESRHLPSNEVFPTPDQPMQMILYQYNINYTFLSNNQIYHDYKQLSLQSMNQISYFITFILLQRMEINEGQQQGFKIQGNDCRDPIEDMTVYPYNNIIFLYADKTIVGTAFLIDQYHALTAAHNLFSNKRVFKEVYFFPYVNNGEISVRDSTLLRTTNKMKDCRYPQEFIKFYDNPERRRMYDYALVRLEKPILQEKYSKLLFDHQFDFKKHPQVEIAGFPGQYLEYKARRQLKKINPYKHTDDLLHQDQFFLTYIADTSKGQSGSPVIYQLDNIKYVIGIHIFGSLSKGNQAISLTKKQRNEIIAWMKEMYTPRVQMYHFGVNGVQQLSSKVLDSGSGVQQKIQDSWHQNKSYQLAKIVVNNTNDITWDIPIRMRKCLQVERDILTYEVGSQIKNSSIFTISFVKIQPNDLQIYKATISKIKDQILIGLITQKSKKLLLEEDLDNGNFHKFLIAYTTVTDFLDSYGRIYYNETIYSKYKKADQSLFTKAGQQIQFGLDFIHGEVYLNVKNNKKLKEVIPTEYKNQDLYIYVLLGKRQDSVKIIKLN